MSKKKKQKYYVVWNGKNPGIYDNWNDCADQVNGFQGAKYKSFKTRELAEDAYRGKSGDFIGKEDYEVVAKKNGGPNLNSITVDAACSNNPGILEYQGVETDGKKELFRKGPYPWGTINLGEFLAIVDGIKYLEQNKLNLPIYSDSITAMKWVKDKKIRTGLERNSKTEKLFQDIDEAIKYLESKKDFPRVIKWETQAWGENPADFGRK